MVFSTDHPTRYRSWIGYLTVICLFVAGVGNATGTRAGVFIGIIIAPVVLHLGWFLLIALDVRELGDTLEGGVFKWMYPLIVFLGVLGVLLYLWDRERNLPSKPRRDPDTAAPA